MSHLSSTMSLGEKAGYAAYILGGSVVVGLGRLGNRAIRGYSTMKDKKQLEEIETKLYGAIPSLGKDQLIAQKHYLTGKLSKAKWETIKGVIELFPIVGPLILLVASLLRGYNPRDYDQDDLRIEGTDPDILLTQKEFMALGDLRQQNNHNYQKPRLEFADLRFLGINNYLNYLKS